MSGDTYNTVSGSAGSVFQARDISGGVNIVTGHTGGDAHDETHRVTRADNSTQDTSVTSNATHAPTFSGDCEVDFFVGVHHGGMRQGK